MSIKVLRFDGPLIQPSFDHATKIWVSKFQNADIEGSSIWKLQNFRVLEMNTDQIWNLENYILSFACCGV